MANHVALMREAAQSLRNGGTLPDGAPLLVADLIEGAAHREDEYIAKLHREGGHGFLCPCEGPDLGDEADMAVRLALAVLGGAE